MPGQVLDIKVKEGDSIRKGDTVIVLSAMKVRLVGMDSIYSPLPSRWKRW